MTRLLLVAALALVAFAAARDRLRELCRRDGARASYAPVVRLVELRRQLRPGRAYVPINVDVLFDEPTVALRGPWARPTWSRSRPTADDLRRPLRVPPRLPGNPLDPGCDYEQWARAHHRGDARRVRARRDRARPPGKLALQYWFFYVFNDCNNKHEGDWEMIQLVFAAADAAQALGSDPIEVGYSQHEGAERAAWDDAKLELVDGTHPVVYPAAGSHANFFDAALYLGSSAEQGFGCDDTAGPPSTCARS